MQTVLFRSAGGVLVLMHVETRRKRPLRSLKQNPQLIMDQPVRRCKLLQCNTVDKSACIYAHMLVLPLHKHDSERKREREREEGDRDHLRDRTYKQQSE